MRRTLTVLAGAALVVGLAAPVWADSKAQPADQPITAQGDHGHGHGDHDGGHRGHDSGHREGHRDHDGGGHGHDHDGYRHHYDRDDYHHGYYRHHYGYDRYYYGCGYYGCGYPYYYDNYYYGGYYGRDYYDRDDYYCGYRGPRYDRRCDCYHRDTRCDRYGYGDGRYRRYDRGCDCYYASEAAPASGAEANTPAADPAPAAESSSPQDATFTAQHADDYPAPPPGAAMTPPPASAAAPSPAPAPAPAPEPAMGHDHPAPAPSQGASPDSEKASVRHYPWETVPPRNTNPDPNAAPGTGRAHYDRPQGSKPQPPADKDTDKH